MMALCCLANLFIPIGPSNPGLGMMLFFILPFISFFLFVTAWGRALHGQKNQVGPTILHGLVVLLCIILWYRMQ